MGRHARGAARLRVSASTVVLGTLIVTVVAVGSLLSSYAQPTPTVAEGLEGTAVEDTVTDGRLLPYGLVLAALLAAGAVAAVWVDAHRGRRDRGRAAHRAALREPDTENAPTEAVPSESGASEAGASEAGASNDNWAARAFGARDETMLLPAQELHRLAESRRPVGRHARPEPDRALSTVDLAFPFTGSLADSLHDELFTHRTVGS